MSNLEISLIGSGNLAWHLAPELDNAGFVVREVYSRNKKNAGNLIDRLYQAEIKTDLDFSESQSAVFIIAVSDDVIESIIQEIVVPAESILVHTSGSKPMDILTNASTPNIGVFYPLQTFNKHKKVNFSDIPICIEAENKLTLKVLKNIGQQLGEKIYPINSASRQTLHIASVFACNFTNHMLTMSKDILTRNNLDFEILKPLIVETINNSLELDPENVQTGPAVRGDLEVLDRHLKALKNNKPFAKIYKVITQDILDTYLAE